MLRIKIAAFLFVSLVFFANVRAQDSTAKSNKAKDSVINALSGKVDIILQNIKKSSEKDIEPTGIMFYDTLRKVPVYTSNGIVTTKKIVIDKVSLLFQDGYIIDIQVFSGNDVFTNTRSPITIDSKRFSSQISDFLFNKMNGDEAIILQQAVFYQPLTTFYPEDKLLILKNSHSADTLKKNVGVNTVLDLRVYTDALAALGNEPNGIFQTDVRLKQFLHRKHYRNEGSKIFQYVKINFTASKLDSKKDFVDSSSNISRTGLFQKAKINAEAQVNLFTSWLGRKTLNNYYFDFGAGFNTVKLAGLKDTSFITIPSLYMEAGITLKNSSNIGFDFYSRYTFQYSPQTDFNDQNGDVKFLRFGGEIYWNPFNDEASRVFGRINYIMGLSSKEKKNSFSQVQIGYSTLLSKVIGK